MSCIRQILSFLKVVENIIFSIQVRRLPYLLFLIFFSVSKKRTADFRTVINTVELDYNTIIGTIEIMMQ